MKDFENETPYFVYVGNAYPHKNLVRLIQAVVLLNSHVGKKVSLYIASSRNSFTQKMEKTIEELKADGFVKLLGFVPDAKINNLYKNSVGFVFPSLSEGFGLPGLEAINAGTLLLASDIPVFKEIYGSNAIYFNQLDFSSIEKAMREALNMPLATRKKIIENGQVFIKRYSWDKMARETLVVYEKSI